QRRGLRRGVRERRARGPAAGVGPGSPGRAGRERRHMAARRVRRAGASRAGRAAAAGGEPPRVRPGDVAAPAVRGGAGRARAAVRDAAPTVVFHLAARASVAESWERPDEALSANVAITLSLLEAVRVEAPAARVVVVGSGEEYGPPDRLPVVEYTALRPQNPYAVSKAAADLLAGMYADAHGLAVVRTRSFNHAGPGQSPAYVV